jgi:hypothetical protein
MYWTYLKVLTKNNKVGVYTTVDIPAKTPIIEFSGNYFTKEELKHPHDKILQIGENMYLGPSGSIDDKIAHSCNPNCRVSIVGYRAILYSLYVIRNGSEVTFDYSTTSTDSDWEMDCKCGSQNCRKVISSFSSLKPELQKEYTDKKIAAAFLINPTFIRKTQ